ncbi:hypothetical protein ACLQ2N_32510 [Streptomyces sp. DT224]|uniref:hypothetical protein n=1 Tax=Streptomyces sp. DT224 TaxID=3393426 RepID=UPI003CF80476
MTHTSTPVTEGTVWIAPAGTAPDEAGAWTLLGFAEDMTLEAAGPDTPLLSTRSEVTFTLSSLYWPRDSTARVIEDHARRERIAAAFAEALTAAYVPPCPAPFPTRRYLER